jgi:hypothetical protein
MTMTYSDIETRHAVAMPPHLEAQLEIPISSGLQRQGDLIFVPAKSTLDGTTQIPAEGTALVRGENGGNTHLLVGEGDVKHLSRPNPGQEIGYFTVGVGAVAYVLHPEHGAQGFAPGSYYVRRQREMADSIRLVAD